jgi:NAD(P)H-dependent FMN reductase
MTKVIGLSGSLRAGSFNSALLAAAQRLMPDQSELVIHTIRGIPLYDADLEAAGMPEPVTRLKNEIASADGLLLATPEYNNSMPGVFKNAIDWLSRPPSDIGRVFHRRPVAVMGASPSGFGTVLSQTAWLPVLKTLHTEPWFGDRLTVARARDVFEHASLTPDEATREQLRRFLRGFVEFIRTRAR